MAVPTTYFDDFLRNIRLTAEQRSDAKKGHTELRKLLTEDDVLGPNIIATFLQGSYRRSTAIKPLDENKSDVDVVVVTDLSEDDYTPREALKLFEPFLEEHYSGLWVPQGRSFGIGLSTVELDLVITSAPSEVQAIALKAASALQDSSSLFDLPIAELNEFAIKSWILESEEATWKTEPLRIPNRDTDAWEDTHPLEQIAWTIRKNQDCNGHFVNVVKAIKWWQRRNSAAIPRPKGYPLEHLVGDMCPVGVFSIEEGIVKTFEQVVERLRGHRAARTVPYLKDRGSNANVMSRITPEQFCNFYDEVSEAYVVAKDAFDSTDKCRAARQWRSLLGDEFPPPSSDCEGKLDDGFTSRTGKTEIRRERFA